MNTSLHTTRSKLHPVLWVAAIAVTIFSLVGIGAITGILPINHADERPEGPVAATAPTDVSPETAKDVAPASVTPSAKTEASKPASHVAAAPHEKRATTHYSSKVASADDTGSSRYTTVPPANAPAPACRDCGVIESITPVTEKGEGTGLGGIIGGIAGGLLGNQIGNGNGRTVATVAGIAGGAYAGNQVEKSRRSTTHYDVTVRFEDGTTQLFRQETAPPWQPGDKVRVESGKITLR